MRGEKHSNNENPPRKHIIPVVNTSFFRNDLSNPNRINALVTPRVTIGTNKFDICCIKSTVPYSAVDNGVSVTIRGASSFNSSSQPLYVVDGIIMNTNNFELNVPIAKIAVF